jgi:hypothetical protein
MRRFFIILAAAFILPAQANASSLFDPSSGYSLDVFAGFANVTSSNSVIPSPFFLETFFYTTAGPITNGTFNDALNQAQNAGTSVQGITVTSTLIGFGPGGADNPIYAYTVSPGASVFSFTPSYAILNPTAGSIFASQQGSAFGTVVTLDLTQNGSNFNGSFNFAGFGSVQFTTSSEFANSDYSSFAVSPVPLPPALPMFASALLALGIFGVFARRQKRNSLIAA